MNDSARGRLGTKNMNMLRSSGPYTPAVYHPLDAKAQEIRLLVLEAGTAEQSVYWSLPTIVCLFV